LILVGSLKRVALALSVVLLVCTWGEVQGNEFFSAVPLPIITGALLALLLHSAKGFNLLQPLLGRRWSSTVTGLGLMLAVLVPGVPNYGKALFFAAWVGACIIQVNHPARAWLAARPMAYMGTISYGMYMLHMLCKNVIVKTLSAIGQAAVGLEIFVLTVLMSIVVARLSFRYFESWFLELKTGFTR
jgi:peptidoglycan/LPS O-acetylase OafA/YrhL